MNKTILLLCPTTTSKIEAQDYVIIWPHNGRYDILWRMWCSSLRWALQDAAQDFTSFLNEMFGQLQWEIHYFRPKNRKDLEQKCASINLERRFNITAMRNTRSRYKLPPWSREPDPYQHPTW